MKKKQGRVLSVIAIVTGLLISGCGTANSADYPAVYTEEATAEYGSYLSDDLYDYESAEYESADYGEEPGSTGEVDTPQVQDTQRKLIKNVNLDVETETFEELLQTLQEKTNRLGGYIESSNTYNGSYYGRSSKNADFTIRIPAKSLDEFLSSVAEASNIVSKSETVTDVTLQYVDMESHKKTLQAEQSRLLELMGQVETIEDIITLENRLSEVRYQIESMEAQLRAMDNQVSYSTVYLTVSEVTKLTPVKELTTGEKIVNGFAENLQDVGEGLLDFAIGVIVSLPYLFVWAVVISIIVIIIRAMIKSSKKKKAKKIEQQKLSQQVNPMQQTNVAQQVNPVQQTNAVQQANPAQQLNAVQQTNPAQQISSTQQDGK